jgi:hypothetical protein
VLPFLQPNTFAMKKDLVLINRLKSLECTELIKMMEDDYYREMIGCHSSEANEKIMNLIDETLEVEIVASSKDVERYDLAVICRDYRVSLADRIILDI